MMKVTGDSENYIALQMDRIAYKPLPCGGKITIGTLPVWPFYAVQIIREGSRLTYRGPGSQITGKFLAELRK